MSGRGLSHPALSDEDGGLMAFRGAAHNKQRLWYCFTNGHVSVEYFLDRAAKGPIRQNWPADQLAAMVAFAQGVREDPHVNPFL